MEFQIQIKKQTDNKQLEDLKKYLDRAKIEQLKSVKIKRAKIKTGEMSGGKILSTLAVIVKGTVAPVSSFFTAVLNYSASRKTDLIIKNRYGDEISLNAKLKREDIILLADKFLAANKNTGRKSR